MKDLEFVERLIKALDESSLDSLELERGGTKVRLSKSPTGGTVQAVAPVTASPVAPAAMPPAPAPEVQAAPEVSGGEAGATSEAQDHLIEVTSPMVGTFYRAPAPDADPYVDVGGQIGVGTVLCIIEAMKLMNELEAEVEGTIVKVMVENAEPVEYGQVLFLVDPS